MKLSLCYLKTKFVSFSALYRQENVLQKMASYLMSDPPPTSCDVRLISPKRLLIHLLGYMLGQYDLTSAPAVNVNAKADY